MIKVLVVRDVIGYNKKSKTMKADMCSLMISIKVVR